MLENSFSKARTPLVHGLRIRAHIVAPGPLTCAPNTANTQKIRIARKKFALAVMSPLGVVRFASVRLRHRIMDDSERRLTVGADGLREVLFEVAFFLASELPPKPGTCRRLIEFPVFVGCLNLNIRFRGERL